MYWLSGFSYPTGFLTALLQTAARATNVRSARGSEQRGSGRVGRFSGDCGRFEIRSLKMEADCRGPFDRESLHLALNTTYHHLEESKKIANKQTSVIIVPYLSSKVADFVQFKKNNIRCGRRWILRLCV